MTFLSIRNRFSIVGFADASIVENTLAAIYDGSKMKGAAAAIDAWLKKNPNKNITIVFSANHAITFQATSTIEIDPDWLNNTVLELSAFGFSHLVGFEAGLAHELGHLTTGLHDTLSWTDLAGPNVTHVNSWLVKLGIPKRPSYLGVDILGTRLKPNFSYTRGKPIANAIWSDPLE
jgi:hypothetical protein